MPSTTLRCAFNFLVIALGVAGCGEPEARSSGAGGVQAAGGSDSAAVAGAGATGGAAGGAQPVGAGAGGAAGTTQSSAGSAGSSGAVGTGGTSPVAAPSYILGADVSWLLEDEAGGASYYDDDVELDLLALLKARGFNYIRIRTCVNPAATGGYAAGKPEAWCDLAHTIELAERVRQQGMGFLLDFHYSDNWADPGQQRKPAAWANLPFSELVTALHDYTKQTIAALVAAGVRPDMVQIGNEITPGMLFPDGSSTDPNWPQLGQLLKAGATAVQEVDPQIRIMLHIEKGGDNATTRWWVDSALEQGVPFQVLGQSCYTEYQGTPAEWQANFEDMVTRYPELDFVIAEYSHEKRAANDIMFGLPEQRGLGTFIWEPTRWMEAVFERSGQRYDGNELLDTYSQMALDYGIAP